MTCVGDTCNERLVSCDRRFDDLRTLMNTQNVAQEKAINLVAQEREKSADLARKDMDRRLESMNMFRSQLEKQAGSFLTREYFEAEHRTLSREVVLLRDWKSQNEGEKSWSNIIAIVAVAISILTGIFHYFATVRGL